jgi:cyclopropane-fatty-acyl-phospholipid synthase
MKAMVESFAERYISTMLGSADIYINGPRPWDIQVQDQRFYRRVLMNGSLGLGESYMDGWWECKALDTFFYKFLRRRLDRSALPKIKAITHYLKATVSNRQSRQKAYEVGERHYDAGNDLFELMLDSHMTYSCAYWKDVDDLDQAQKAKLDLICRKLRLEPGMRLLDIGCGWGGLARYAAEHYDVTTVGLTISKEQAELAQQRCRGLPVEIRLEDYRDIDGTYDAIVSVGMFEHVGYKNYKRFMEVARRCLNKEGLLLLHTIASNRTRRHCDPWFDKYIFPNGMLPSIKQIGDALEDTFVMEDWQNMGAYYDRTLMAWYANFQRNRDRLKQRYNERFQRMWRYYLLSVAGAFRARTLQVWQLVLSPEGVVGGYPGIRCARCVDE